MPLKEACDCDFSKGQWSCTCGFGKQSLLLERAWRSTSQAEVDELWKELGVAGLPGHPQDINKQFDPNEEPGTRHSKYPGYMWKFWPDPVTKKSAFRWVFAPEKGN